MPRHHLKQLGHHFQSSSPPPEDEPSGMRGYPRPQLRRKGWHSLNGTWEFEIDPEGLWQTPEQVPFSRRILVPFSPETPKSGIEDTGLFRACWYRRTIECTGLGDDERLLLHFGAVDYEATIWVDGHYVGQHEGGYTPFFFDVSDYCKGRSSFVLTVRAFDDPADLCKPRGKQDWQLVPHSIWYPRTSGIWQTVWLERAPLTRIHKIFWTPNLTHWDISMSVQVTEPWTAGLKLGVRLSVGGMCLSDDVYSVVAGEVNRRIGLSDPGIDDFRNELLWSPTSPKLIDAELTLYDGRGQVVDVVRSYTALRSILVQGDRFVLNGQPFPLQMVLDQGYWDECGLTALDDASIKRDVELAKAMGFNGVRKHQKLEDPRYLYWADKLGMLVWSEMPSAYRFTKLATQRFIREWTEAILRDYSHPCVIAWVPFNESWGVPSLTDSPMQVNYVKAIYYLTKSLDPTRPVIGNDGWESSVTDIIGIHDYDSDPVRLERRYQAHDVLQALFQRERPGGRVLLLEDHAARTAEIPVVLSEFGGIAFAGDDATTSQGEQAWGYSKVTTPEGFADAYKALLHAVGGARLLAGFCYTQFADTYQEQNGLLRSDRTPKIPLAVIAAATHGQQPGHPNHPLGPPFLRRDEGTG